MNSILLLGLIIILVLFWHESLQVREFVTKQCKTICEQAGLQLLDQTVALDTISFSFSRADLFHINRVYKFEVSQNGVDRINGYLSMKGKTIETIQTITEDGATILHQSGHKQLH